jgi:ketosteroid isomerase-like protein
MSTMLETAEHFFVACETGKGWDGCQEYCHPDASFSAQSPTLVEVRTVEAYANWMRGLLEIIPDGTYELGSFAEDAARDSVNAYAIFRGTHTGEGGPVAPTGARVESDYAYVMRFEDGRIRHMTKIWNDTYALAQLGWA